MGVTADRGHSHCYFKPLQINQLPERADTLKQDTNADKLQVSTLEVYTYFYS